MTIKLINKIPSQDGYYLMKFNPKAGLHLILIQTEFNGVRVLYPDSPKSQILTIDFHTDVLQDALFSEEPINIV